MNENSNEICCRKISQKLEGAKFWGTWLNYRATKRPTAKVATELLDTQYRRIRQAGVPKPARLICKAGGFTPTVFGLSSSQPAAKWRRIPLFSTMLTNEIVRAIPPG